MLCRQSPAGQKKQKKISSQFTNHDIIAQPCQEIPYSIRPKCLIAFLALFQNSNSIQMTTSFVILTVEKNIADNHLSCTVIQRLARWCFMFVLGRALLFPQKRGERKKGKQRSFQ